MTAFHIFMAQKHARIPCTGFTKLTTLLFLFLFLSTYQIPEKNMLFPVWRQMELSLRWSTMQHNFLWEQLPLQSILINLFRKKKIAYSSSPCILWAWHFFNFVVHVLKLNYHFMIHILLQSKISMFELQLTLLLLASSVLPFFFSCASLCVHAYQFLCYFMFLLKSSPIHHVS